MTLTAAQFEHALIPGSTLDVEGHHCDCALAGPKIGPALLMVAGLVDEHVLGG